MTRALFVDYLKTCHNDEIINIVVNFLQGSNTTVFAVNTSDINTDCSPGHTGLRRFISSNMEIAVPYENIICILKNIDLGE